MLYICIIFRKSIRKAKNCSKLGCWFVNIMKFDCRKQFSYNTYIIDINLPRYLKIRYFSFSS